MLDVISVHILQVPSQSNEDPLHSVTGVDSEQSSISVNIADSEGDLMNWTIEKKYLEHQLSGEWKNHKDCHVEPDWVLISKISEDSIILERTGSHSDLF